MHLWKRLPDKSRWGCDPGLFITISGSILWQQHPIYTKKEIKWISFSKCWLWLHPAPPPPSTHLLLPPPSKRPGGMKENVSSSREKREKALNAWEWLEIHSKLMGDKDNVLLIFCPITLWLMCWCWEMVAGAVPAHFTWWNRLFFCQNNLGQICVCCDSYSRGIVAGGNQPLYNYAVKQISVIVGAGWSQFVSQVCF